TGRVALAEALRVLRYFLFQRVGSKGRKHRAPAGQDTQCAPYGCSTYDSGPGLFEFLLVRIQATDLAGQVHTLVLEFKVVHDLGETEHAHGHDREVDTVLQFGNAEIVAGNTRVHIGADH